MFDYSISFDRPWYLVLLVLVPIVWWFSLRSLSGLGPVRRIVALLLRSAVLVLLILAAAEMQLVRTSQKLTVIYLVDYSLSIPEHKRTAMLDYIKQDVKKHRDATRQDRAGLIVFGREAAIEVPPFDDDLQVGRAESPLQTDYTNLAAAMKLAQASFPEDAAKRVVVLSDGNENMGNALEQARALTDGGIGIDVVPISYPSRAEVAVEKVTIPPDVRRGQPFDLRVVVNNATPETAPDGGTVHGRLRVIRKSGNREEVLSEEEVTLGPGKRVFSIREQIDAPEFYTYEARFTPAEGVDDAMPQNNRATTFTHVGGRAQVLLIEDHENRGEFDYLIERLKSEQLEVTLRSTSPDEIFTSLPELQPFDTVILGNVPREHFSDSQIKILVSNTQQMGSGLIMLGGPNSFGAGGWTNTELEKAMPLDFQIKSGKVEAVGALCLLMHASEIAEGNFWQKVVARESIRTLGNHDYCGLIHWEGVDRWLWGKGLIKVGGGNRDKMLALVDRMQPGDMPEFDPSLKMAAAGFARLTDAAVKHMIIISDGDPSPPSAAAIKALVDLNVKISTVAVGAHGPAESQLLQRIATQTGGKYYAVTDPRALPRIYQKEARRVARPLIYQRDQGFRPYVTQAHEMIKGIEGQLPPITAYVLTQKKENPLVEVAVVAPEPADEGSRTILAGWTYGLGRTVAFTTDAGRQWAAAWTGWENYDKFFSQMVQWSMRPAGDQGKFHVTTDVADGKVRMTITALDKNDEFLNFLNIAGTAVAPDLEGRDVTIRQTAPGRYVGEFDAKDAGSYFILLNPGAGMTPLRLGVNVPYSAEFMDREPNIGLLDTLASMVPRGGGEGKIIDDPTGYGDVNKLLETNTFRHDLPKATSSQDIWYLLLLSAACLFFADVFVRRVVVDFAWVPAIVQRARNAILGRPEDTSQTEYLKRLQSRKAEVSTQLEQRRAATRFEPAPDAVPTATALEEELAESASDRPAAWPRPQQAKPPEQQEQDDYTSRLLKAKKKVWKDRKDDERSES